MSKSKATQVATHGDCVKLLRKLPRKANLLICDPPYSFGMPYDAYDDNLTYEEYMTWTGQWMDAAVQALDKNGSMFVFVPDEWVSEVDILARKKLKLYKQRQIIWAFTFGQKAQKNFTRSHCHILYFTKSRTFTFNVDEIKVPSARQLVYNDKRAVAGGKPPDDTWMLLSSQMEPYMQPDQDTWLVSRICGTFKERRKHSPNQIPVPIMDRIVRACSNPGDLVVDPFCGSGSSAMPCKEHGRDWTGFDVSKTCISETQKRLGHVRTVRNG